MLTTDELIQELMLRCDHGVVVTLRCDYPCPRENTRKFQWKGNEHTCAGLAFDVAHEALQAFRKNTSNSTQVGGIG
jgi:hypothetical protein